MKNEDLIPLLRNGSSVVNEAESVTLIQRGQMRASLPTNPSISPSFFILMYCTHLSLDTVSTCG